jgi:hypothetical protein
MKAILDVITSFVTQTGHGALPPNPNTLDGHVPNLEGLARDDLGIICQLQEDKTLDGGDSAHRTGVAAFCNSGPDADLLRRFEDNNGIMVRHPTQVPWNNPNNCTRDQLTGYVAGCWRAGRLDINRRLLEAHANRKPPFTCQDTERDYPGTPKDPPIGDPLGPDNIMFLRIAAGDTEAYTDLLGQFSLQISIELADRGVTSDQNNLILESIVCGRLNLYVKVHPNYDQILRYYWSNWRGQPRIAEELIWVIKQELKRYPSQAEVPLLPQGLLNSLRRVGKELQKLDPVRP